LSAAWKQALVRCVYAGASLHSPAAEGRTRLCRPLLPGNLPAVAAAPNLPDLPAVTKAALGIFVNLKLPGSPVLSVVEFRIDVENDAAEREQAVAHHLADLEFCNADRPGRSSRVERCSSEQRRSRPRGRGSPRSARDQPDPETQRTTDQLRACNPTLFSSAILPTAVTKEELAEVNAEGELAMWSWLASLIWGTGVITGLIKAYQAKLDPANIQDRMPPAGMVSGLDRYDHYRVPGRSSRSRGFSGVNPRRG
jgi:hypothetical protein